MNYKYRLIGLSIILLVLLVGIYFVADRYEKSSKDNWHLINFKNFKIETPKEFYYFLEQGVHGGEVGGITNSKDTISFVFGKYHFQACEEDGTCDTLDVFKKHNNEIVFVKTDNDLCAFIKRDENGYILKMWTNLTFDRQLIEQIFRTIEKK